MFEIKCPMCKGTIWVDPSSGKVVDHKSADHKKTDFGSFVESQKNRGSKLEDQFMQAKAEQDRRKKEMEAKFREAKDHPEDLKEDLPSPFDWD